MTMQAAIAMIVFNRPEPTQRVFERVRQARPSRLYLIADGPRADRPGEAELCEQARQVVLDGVDWDCDVRTNLAEENLGCTERVTSGLDWLFEQEERAIILEDDCLVDPTFFRFCDELLERYADCPDVSLITAQNVIADAGRAGHSYWFSRFQLIWGWATWRRTWVACQAAPYGDWLGLRDTSWLTEWLGDEHQARCWKAIFDGIATGSIEDWSFRLSYAAFRNRWLSVSPSNNLVTNLGFGEGGTTTTDVNHRLASLETNPIHFPLSHPDEIRAAEELDRRTFREIFDFMPNRDVSRPWWRLWYKAKRVLSSAVSS